MRARLTFLGIGHAYAHLFMLVFATAVLGMEATFGAGYAHLLALATPAFVCFGVCALPAGWLADHWSRRGMIAVFFLGTGAAALFVSTVDTTLGLAIGLTLIGVFASIYHPVGIAMVVEGRAQVGRTLAINGIAGNLGVAFAALIAGVLTETVSWRAAFAVPGAVAVLTGIAYLLVPDPVERDARAARRGASRAIGADGVDRAFLMRVLAVVAAASLLGGIVFDGSSIPLPKVLEARAGGLADSPATIGWIAWAIFFVAAFAQYVVGFLIDRFPIQPVFVVVQVAKVAALCVVAVATGLGLIVALLGLMLFVFGGIPITDTLIARHTNPAVRAKILGVKTVLVFGISLVTLPMIAFLQSVDGSLALLYLVLAVLAGLVGVAALLLPRAQPVATAAPAAGD